MQYAINANQLTIIVYTIEDSVVTNTDSPCRFTTTLEFRASLWTRISLEALQRGNNPLLRAALQRFDLLGCPVVNFDAVPHDAFFAKLARSSPNSMNATDDTSASST